MSLLAIPPTNAEAADPADRFCFRIPVIFNGLSAFIIFSFQYEIKDDVTRISCKNIKGKTVVTDYIAMPVRSKTKAQGKDIDNEVSVSV